MALGIVLCCFYLLRPAWGGNGQSLTVAWDASTDPTVVGYTIYYGTNSQAYSTQLDVGTNLSVTISNLNPGLTYYIAVGDYNSQGLQSAPSSPITYLVPGYLLVSTTNSGGLKNISFPVAPSHWYELQASTNLQTWATIWQTAVSTSNAWVQYTDPQSGLISRRFYRVIPH